MTASDGPAPFSEETFYRNQFRGRTMGIAVPDDLIDEPELRRVIEVLLGNGTRVVVIGADREALERCGWPHVAGDAPRFAGQAWRQLRQRGVVGASATGWGLDDACLHVATALRLAKVVRIEERGAPGGSIARGSFVHLAQLRADLAAASAALNPSEAGVLNAVRILLEAGIPAVNTCTLEGLQRELFTYAGSGTLFTRERYIRVQPLGIEDYDAAESLIRRGTEEGYLAPRSSEEIDHLLAGGFGAFLDGSHLAGIGSLRRLEEGAAEIASLYTLTRFLGEGVGPHLVRFAVDQGRDRGLSDVFACTTSDSVGRFFARHGFEAVDADELPDAKWQGYDPARRARLRCFRRDLRGGDATGT